MARITESVVKQKLLSSRSTPGAGGSIRGSVVAMDVSPSPAPPSNYLLAVQKLITERKGSPNVGGSRYIAKGLGLSQVSEFDTALRTIEDKKALVLERRDENIARYRALQQREGTSAQMKYSLSKKIRGERDYAKKEFKRLEIIKRNLLDRRTLAVRAENTNTTIQLQQARKLEAERQSFKEENTRRQRQKIIRQTASVETPLSARPLPYKIPYTDKVQMGLLSGGRQARVIESRSGKTVLVQEGASLEARNTFTKLGYESPEIFELNIVDKEGEVLSSVRRERKKVTATTEAEARFAGLPGVGSYNKDTFVTSYINPDVAPEKARVFDLIKPQESVIIGDPRTGTIGKTVDNMNAYAIQEFKERNPRAYAVRESVFNFAGSTGAKIAETGFKVRTYANESEDYKLPSGIRGNLARLGIFGTKRTGEILELGGGYIEGVVSTKDKPVTGTAFLGGGFLLGMGSSYFLNSPSLTANTYLSRKALVNVGTVGLGGLFAVDTAVEVQSQPTLRAGGAVLGARSVEAGLFVTGAVTGGAVTDSYYRVLAKNSPNLGARKAYDVDSYGFRPDKAIGADALGRAGKVGGRSAKARSGKTSKAQQRKNTFNVKPRATKADVLKAKIANSEKVPITLEIKPTVKGFKVQPVKSGSTSVKIGKAPAKNPQISDKGRFLFKSDTRGDFVLIGKGKGVTDTIGFPKGGLWGSKPKTPPIGKTTPVIKTTPQNANKPTKTGLELYNPQKPASPSKIDMYGGLDRAVTMGLPGGATKIGKSQTYGTGILRKKLPYVPPPQDTPISYIPPSQDEPRYIPGSPDARRASALSRLRELAENRRRDLTREETIIKNEVTRAGSREVTNFNLGQTPAFGTGTGFLSGFNTGDTVASRYDFDGISGTGRGEATSPGYRYSGALGIRGGSRYGQATATAQAQRFDQLFDTSSSFAEPYPEPPATTTPGGRGRGGRRLLPFDFTPTRPGRPPQDPFKIPERPFEPPVETPRTPFAFSFGLGSGVFGGGLSQLSTKTKTRVTKTLVETEFGLGGDIPLSAPFTGFELARTRKKKKKARRKK